MPEFSTYIEASKAEMFCSLKKLLSYNSVSHGNDEGYPYGRETAEALSFMLSLAGSMGFRTFNMDNRVGWCEYGEGDEMVAVVCHLDIVPAGKGWSFDPFGGEEHNGRIYGRGTVDDKGPAVAALYALKAVKDSGVPVSRRIRILFGCSEEVGCDDMEYYLSHGGEIPVTGFTPDGEYPLINGEKGIVIQTFRCPIEPGILKEISGGSASNIVPAEASAVFEDGTVLEEKGISVHGSTPEKGVNAIGKLMLRLAEFPLTGRLKTAVDFLACKIGLETGGESLGIALEDEVSGRLTFNLGIIRCDGASIETVVNYRYPVTFSSDDCVPRVTDIFLCAGFELVSEQIMKPLYVPADSKLVKTLIGIYNNYMNTNAAPISIGGGTYAKSIPNIVAFGPLFPGEEVTEHQPDEYIDKQHMVDIAVMSARAMHSLAV